jgi:2,5-diketo-D-gluconate reductase A
MIELNNGAEMPALGLGVFLAPPEQTADAVETAITTGYRLVDTAAAYNNERQVGEGIRRSGIDRSEIFVTTKLWVADYGYDSALRAFDASLRRLGFDYIDLYLLHWPVPTDFDATVAAYKAAEKILADGRARSIGVSNFQPQHLESLIRRTGVVPAVNQIEVHPYFANSAARAASTRHGVAVEAWSPLGQGKELDDPVISRIAAARGKSSAQVILRWHIQHGRIVIPKTMHHERMEENAHVFDFELSAEEMASIDALDWGEGGRIGPNPNTFDWIPCELSTTM